MRRLHQCEKNYGDQAFKAKDLSLDALTIRFAFPRQGVRIDVRKAIESECMRSGEQVMGRALFVAGPQLRHNAVDNRVGNALRQFEGITLGDDLDRFQRGVVQNMTLPAMMPMLLEFHTEFR